LRRPAFLSPTRGTGNAARALDLYKPEFVELVRSGRVLDMRVLGDQMEIDVSSQTLFPLRPDAKMNVDGAAFEVTANRVRGTVIYADDHARIAKDYKDLQGHNPPTGRMPRTCRRTRWRPNPSQ